STENRLLLCIAGLMLLDATIGGAVASHVLTNLDERSLRSFATAVGFEFFHALGLVGVVLVAERVGVNAWLRVTAWLLVAGVVVFCGSIGAATFGAPRGVLALAPYGGVALMAAWLAFAIGVWRGRGLRAPSGLRFGRRASELKQIRSQSSGKSIPTAAAARGSRLAAVSPGSVLTSRHQIAPSASIRKSTRL